MRKETFYKLTNSADVPGYPASGNRNLLLYTNMPFAHTNDGYYSPYYAYATTESVNNSAVYKTGPNDWSRLGINLGRHLVERGVVKAGDEVTYSVLAKTDQDTPIKITLYVRYKDSGSAQEVNGKPHEFILTKDWRKIEIPFTITEKMVSESTRVGTFSFEQTSKNETGKYIYYASNKIELGNTATPYDQAPEDLGWSTDTLVPTQSNRYLWKFEYIYYSDGGVEITSPVNLSIAGANGATGPQGPKGDKGDIGPQGIQGLQGPKGDQGIAGNDGSSIYNSKYTGIKENLSGMWITDLTPSVSIEDLVIGSKVISPYGDVFEVTSKNASSNPPSFGVGALLTNIKGKDGLSQYTHIAYADDSTGGGFSQTDQTKAYIGMYVDFTATDSTDVTKYKWTKWKGDKGETGAQGIQGPKGSDGRTPYLHIAYANSADGKTDFTTSNTDNKRYLGTYTDYTQADSTDPTKYKWVDMVGTVEVSARNLWIQSKATGGFVEETLPDNHITGQKKCYRITNNAEIKFNIEPDFSPRLYRTVTFSAWVKYENVVQGTNSWNVFNLFKHEMYRKNSSTGLTTSIDYTTLKGFTGTSDWEYVTYTYDYAANKSYDQLKTTIRFNLESVKSGTAWVTGVMVQFGNIATGHVWAPEDIQADIDSKADQGLTQDQLNALTEKNDLIKAEMEAKASIDTVNQWITAYQNYVKANDDAQDKSEKALQDASARLLQLNTDVGALKQQWTFIDTYMTVQNEGLIIGKSDGSAYAKFANDRISLFSGGSEVMYISQGVLRIENGIFTKTIQIGRFRFETHPADKDTLVLRYLGGV
ncbi:hypothetical protein Si105_00123 [Streptococcus infantarius subsp. infantarius]|nr:hypothetical protein [Streptococcus infantarius subsp. infantarius]